MNNAATVIDIITRECQRLGIDEQDIDDGCEYAEFMLRGKSSIANCVLAGIAVAKRQKLASFISPKIRSRFDYAQRCYPA